MCWNRLKKKTTCAICTLLVISFPYLIRHTDGLINHNQISVTCEVDLAHWRVKDPSKIGYVSLGILHKESGDELKVYDIRKERPHIKEPSKPKSQIPPFRDDVFLVDDFQQGNVNRLGGYFSALFKSPSESRITIETSPEGTRSLKFSYRQEPPGFAGFWIHFFDFKAHPVNRIFLNAAPFRYLTFTIRGHGGNEKLMLQMADYSWEKREDSVEIGPVERFLPSGEIKKDWQRVWVPLAELPENINGQELASLVLLARSGRGGVLIGDIAFTTRKDVRIPSSTQKKIFEPSPNRAMWLWETKELLGDEQGQDKLLDFCRRKGITEIFLQLPYERKEREGTSEIIWDESKMKSLLSKLHGAEIRIHALDGDPRFALREWHDHVIATIQSITQFNKSAKPGERFDGIRYDNEPYLLPNFAGIQKESILKQYWDILRISQSISESGGLEFGVDTPFWFDQKNEFFEPITELEGRPLIEHVIDIVDNIGIMDYRTEAYGADGVIAHALGELRYASEKGKKVFVGLETTDVPDETIMEFERGEGSSAILLKKTEGTKILLQWIPEIIDMDSKKGIFLFARRTTFVPSEKLTFRNKKLVDLAEVMEKTESEFSRFPSFYGFAIHHYKSYKLMQQK